ncbi:Insulin-like growth factor-binding protein complex acid labile subunit, partial [Trichoplax sp. H2]
DFANNRLYKIDPLAFINAENLKVIYINNNKLQELRFLQTIPSLEEVNASSNFILNLDQYVFTQLRSLKILDISSNHLQKIDSEAFVNCSNLTELYLENVGLTSLSQINMTKLDKLTKLIIRNNKILKLENESFEGLTALQLLDLSKNMISHLSSKVFSLAQNLFKITVDENQLSTFDSGILCTNRKIAFLSFQSNKISKVIDTKCPGDYTRIEGINLNNNRLDDGFAALLKRTAVLKFLSELNIGSNQITKFPEEITRLTKISLRAINIGYNRVDRKTITNFIEGLYYFNYLACLQTPVPLICKFYSIDLSGSYLTKLNHGSFADIHDSLGALYLSDNHLVQLDVADLFNVTNNVLQNLYLANNKLKTITTRKKYQMNNLLLLSLVDNPLVQITASSFYLTPELKEM